MHMDSAVLTSNQEIDMSITVAIRKAGASTPYKGLSIVTVNGVDHAFPEPHSEAAERVERVNAAIASMRAAGQSDVEILGKYNALPHQK